jgi:hypothetical protein
MAVPVPLLLVGQTSKKPSANNVLNSDEPRVRLVSIVDDALQKLLTAVRTKVMRNNLPIHITVVKMQTTYISIDLVDGVFVL